MNGRPALFGLPPGVDFAACLIEGLDQRFATFPPDIWGRTTLLVNSGRMARRIQQQFDHGPARLVPRIVPLSDLDSLARGLNIPKAMPHLSIVLTLTQFLDALTDAQPNVTPKAAIFDLAHGLADLIDELEGEGEGPAALERVKVDDFAAHWQRSRAIIDAAYGYIAQIGRGLPGAEARRRRIVDALVETWRTEPPRDPVFVVGSTGSRRATRRLMSLVATLPSGGLVLPGFDFSMPMTHWQALDDSRTAEDHPQYRFHVLLSDLGATPDQVIPWVSSAGAPVPERGALISLALCPAPVTDLWRAEANKLPALDTATSGVSLVEAPSPRMEAAAIALRLRAAVNDGQRAALITPDRDLSRQVTAALNRWGIEPDDSGGTPLQQTPPGRFLRMTTALFGDPLTLPELLALLKHPLTATGGERGTHLLATRELELYLRRHAVVRPSTDTIRAFSQEHAEFAAWAEWISGILRPAPPDNLPAWVARHVELSEQIARGPVSENAGDLWAEGPGRAAQSAMSQLQVAAPAHEGHVGAPAYADLLNAHLGRSAVTDPRRPHPDVMIWGTLEVRAGVVDVAILGGLNDGTWPGLPPPDPWLNRTMRADAGLLLPERQIGLAAHDFQIAVAARDVLLTRATRDADAETVPSRWLNRLTNLLGGLGDKGQVALQAMQDRGQRWLTLARALEEPSSQVPTAARPAPRPPVSARPRSLSVTRITTLIRDPYAIYAQHILKLHALAPLHPRGDARERGIALHAVMDAFLETRSTWRSDPEAARAELERVARTHLARHSADPAVRLLWQARFLDGADRLLAGELARLSEGDPVLSERRGALTISDPDFTLTATPDRIDRRADGTYAVFDYKSGSPPTPNQVEFFEKQLPLEAAMAERDAFPGLGPAPVSAMKYIALGVSGSDVDLPVEARDGARTSDMALDGLRRLIRVYGRKEQGYTAQRAAERTRFSGDYDHLSRYGEWDLSDRPEPLDLGDPS